MYRGHPELLVKGHYVFAPDSAVDFPGDHVLGSREWCSGEWAFDPVLGEAKAYPHAWNNGSPPEPFPRPVILGSVECLQGEETLPKPIIRLMSDERTEDLILVGDLPDLEVRFGSFGVPVSDCDLLLVGDGFLLVDPASLLEVECHHVCFPDCDLLLVGGGFLLVDPASLLEVECRCPMGCDLLMVGDSSLLLWDASGMVEVSCLS